jgi:MFS family permease
LTTPATLLALVFALGCGQALTSPAWQAIQPELVPRSQIPAAAALGSLSMNIARAIGPAIAGFLVALSGPSLVFALNAASFVGIVVVLLGWRRPLAKTVAPAERPLAALSAGTRFIRASPAIRRLLFRALLFIAPASALWALLPLVASHTLGLSASGYGLMLGALGAGAVVGALTLGPARRRFSATLQLGVSALAFALGTAALAVIPNFGVLLVMLMLSGLAWLLSLSTLNAMMQLRLPGWVRARGLSVYLLVFMGGQAIGSLFWGLVAQLLSLNAALLISGALLVLCAVSVIWWPLYETAHVDVTPSAHWPEPMLALDPDPSEGPVLVLRYYCVPESDLEGFRQSMGRVGRSLQRTGAMQWRLFRDGAAPDRYVEAFVVRSWDDHLRQHHSRLTLSDQAAEAAAAAFSSEPPRVEHWFAVDLPPSPPRRQEWRRRSSN